MNSRTSEYITFILYYLFAVCFTWLLMNIVLNNTTYSLNALAVVVSACLFAFLFYNLNNFVLKLENRIARYELIIIVLLLFIVFVAQVTAGYWLQIEPVFDVEAIYRGAISLKDTGTLGNFTEYFYKFPHNLGGLILLKITFSVVDILGIHNYNFSAIILNCIFINLSLLMIYLICKRLFGRARAMSALLLSIFCIPLFMCTPVFYTDSLTILFPVLIYYLFLLGKHSEITRKKVIYFSLMGLVTALGTNIKFTVIIMLIAILMEILMTCKIKKYFLPIGCCIAVFVGVNVIFHAYVNGNLLENDKVKQQSVPYLHWVMMGLSGDGSYNPSDYNFTNSFTNPYEKKQAIMKEIKARLQSYDIFGYIDFLSKKGVRSFGSGFYGVYEMLDDQPQHDTWLHDYVLESGAYFKDTHNILQGYHIFLLSLIIFSTFVALRNTKGLNFIIVAPKLAVFGLYIFLLLWESNSRYITNYIPIFIICAVSGLDSWRRFSEKTMKYIF